MWRSKTGHFTRNEIDLLEGATAGELAEMLVIYSSLVVLRVLTEIRLNGDADKLASLLRSPAINRLWQGYARDRDATDRDDGYALELQELLK